jgi:hypothetical protein
MYTANFPDGTTYAIKLPSDIYAKLMSHVDIEGIINASAGDVHGNYLDFAGYKVKITKLEVTPTGYKVRLV